MQRSGIDTLLRPLGFCGDSLFCELTLTAGGEAAETSAGGPGGRPADRRRRGGADPGYQWESDKLTVDTPNESQEVSPFLAGDHKAHINRRAQRHSKHKTEQKHKRSTKEVPPWNGQ